MMKTYIHLPIQPITLGYSIPRLSCRKEGLGKGIQPQLSGMNSMVLP